jgi:transposase
LCRRLSLPRRVPRRPRADGALAWLDARPAEWKDKIEVVAMDGFTGFKTATAEEVPDATAVMDPFHVVRLAGDALDECRRRVQQQLHGHRGRKDDPHVEVEATWGIYQRMIAAYRQPERARGRELMKTVIDSVATGVPPGKHSGAPAAWSGPRRARRGPVASQAASAEASVSPCSWGFLGTSTCRTAGAYESPAGQRPA